MINHGDVQITVESVDPAYAKELLIGNTNNRNQRPIQVRSLSRLMKTGAWKFNGDPIRMTANGTILDGQHRLSAVVDSGTTQDFVIQRGLPEEVFSTIDTGARRTGGDSLRVHGIKDSLVTASIMHGYLTSKGVYGPTVSEIEQNALAMNDRLHEALSVSREAGKVLGSKKLMGVAALYLLEANRWAATEFFDSLASGAGLPAGDPRLALRNRFLKGTVNTNRISTPSDLRPVLNMVFRSWNAWRTGRTVASVQIVKTAPGRLAPPLIALER